MIYDPLLEAGRLERGSQLLRSFPFIIMETFGTPNKDDNVCTMGEMQDWGILLNRIMWGFDVLITLVYEFLVRYMNYYNVNIHLFHRGTYTLHPGLSLNDFLPKVSVILKNYFWYLL